MPKPKPTFIHLATIAALGACGQAPARAPEPAHEAEQPPPRPALQMKSELGSVDPGEVKRAFHALDDRFTECQKHALERIEVLSGAVKLFVRISETGSAKWAYLEDSDLGDRATEKCVIDAVMDGRYPKPDGGEAEVRYGMEMPLEATRPPTDWSADKVTHALAKHAGAIHRCEAAGGQSLRATLYVGPGGRVLAAGIAGTGKDGDDEADCIAGVLEKLRGLPSPGSWPAKVTVTL